MKILVVTPTHDEYRLFKEALKRIPVKHSYLVLETGIGKVNAAAAVSLELYGSNKHYDLIAVVGFAAGCALYKQGDFVVPQTTVCYDFKVPSVFALPSLLLLGHENCTCLTGDSFVTKENYKEISEHSLTKNVIFDMETYAVAQVAEETPTICMKIISDIPAVSEDEQAYSKFVATQPSFAQFIYFLEEIYEPG